MKFVLTALAFAIATPALARSADPHAGHKALAVPAEPTHADPDPAKKGCCADEAKSGADAHAGHHSH